LTAGLVSQVREAGTEEVAIPALWNRVSMQEVDALVSDPFVVLIAGSSGLDEISARYAPPWSVRPQIQAL